MRDGTRKMYFLHSPAASVPRRLQLRWIGIVVGEVFGAVRHQRCNHGHKQFRLSPVT